MPFIMSVHIFTIPHALSFSAQKTPHLYPNSYKKPFARKTQLYSASYCLMTNRYILLKPSSVNGGSVAVEGTKSQLQHQIVILILDISFLNPVDCTQPTRLLCPWNSPCKNTGVGCHFLFQGIFPIQGSNPHLQCLLPQQAVLYHWATQEAPSLSYLLMILKNVISSVLLSSRRAQC